jgi:hypothetical protein
MADDKNEEVQHRIKPSEVRASGLFGTSSIPENYVES